MSETIRIEDMRLFAKVAEAKSFTGAARALHIPKQTLSRRMSELERALGVDLLLRTTRRVQLTEAGAAYAERCGEIVRLADDANRAVSEVHEVPRGMLRVTADPVFGEAFLSDLAIEFASKWPETRLEVVLTRRRVDLIEERFDVAFRIGQPEDGALTGLDLGSACIRYCASPTYLEERGTPSKPDDLKRHDCIVVSDGGPTRWPFSADGRPKAIPVAGRLTFSNLAMARAAAIAGLGIGLFPEFACAEDLRMKRLVSILEPRGVDVGSVWILYPAHRFLPARVRAFVDLAKQRFRAAPPWLASKRADGDVSVASSRRRNAPLPRGGAPSRGRGPR